MAIFSLGHLPVSLTSERASPETPSDAVTGKMGRSGVPCGDGEGRNINLLNSDRASCNVAEVFASSGAVRCGCKVGSTAMCVLACSLLQCASSPGPIGACT